MGKCFHHLPGDFIVNFSQRELRYFDPGFSRARSGKVEKPTRADSPAHANRVVLLCAERISNTASSAAEPAKKTLCAESRNERAVSGAVVCFTRSPQQRFV